jgi:hypothetical protein
VVSDSSHHNILVHEGVVELELPRHSRNLLEAVFPVLIFAWIFISMKLTQFAWRERVQRSPRLIGEPRKTRACDTRISILMTKISLGFFTLLGWPSPKRESPCEGLKKRLKVPDPVLTSGPFAC